MWFLQTDTLQLLCLICILFGLASCLAKDRYPKLLRLLPLVELLFLGYVSVGFTVFYVVYILLTWGFVLLLRRVEKGRAVVFGLLCAGCILPLVYSRFSEELALPMYGVALIGMAYNMLKAIDVLYYEYFTGEKADLEVYCNYMLFLPVLTAGPVFRYRDFQKTWARPGILTLDRFTEGVRRIIRGLFSKVVLSAIGVSLLGTLTADTIVWYESLLIPPVSLAILYFDMSGYASVAIGLGSILGIQVPENFKKPFQCASFTQFWRNWHVTVSDWIREHVFILFRKTKLSKWQGAAVSVMVMVIMGLWHDFTVLYLVDGVILGLFLAIEAIFGLGTVNKRKTPKWNFRMRCFAVFYLFALNSMIFTLTTEQIGQVFRGFVTMTGGLG